MRAITCAVNLTLGALYAGAWVGAFCAGARAEAAVTAWLAAGAR